MNNFDLRHIGQGDHIGVTTSKPVELRNALLLTDDTEDITLDVKITADFSTIPEKYHEVFLNMMTHSHNVYHQKKRNGGNFGKSNNYENRN
jgi:hypothetical protein